MARRTSFQVKRSGTVSLQRFASDIVAFMDALKIDKAIIGGCDWGARTANIIAALCPSAARPWSP